LIREESLDAGADAAVVSNNWAKGGVGAKNLAEAVVTICEGESEFRFLYDLNLSIEEKIGIIGKEIYGADGIELSDLAKRQVDIYAGQGYSGLPSKYFVVSIFLIILLRMFSLHGEDSIFILTRSQAEECPDRSVPTNLLSTQLDSFLGFKLPIRTVRLSAGAGFLYPILGDMQTMPGLGTRPGKICILLCLRTYSIIR